jgi:hypothetical protein
MRSIVVCALLVATLSSAACTTKKTVTIDELRVMNPLKAWITENDQTVVMVAGPQVVGDTVVGYINGVYEEMPAARLKQVMVETPAKTRTYLLVGGITVALGGMIYALIGGAGDTPYGGPDYCDEHPEDPICDSQ